uniref:S-adenosylmethionine transporter n=1 Tax=Rhodosorus marinus TaxID=101924 RepID=A0A7S0BKN0_9RHOD|mmetsp:Transcript_21208/g.30813  ORF Transcript_21208/g.30813 Transcript_21208/m.30813 type:complete len:282 (+) Transcript_21208:402-1247(+)
MKLVGLVSGALAGCVVDVALFPLDTVKTRLQSGVTHSGPIFEGVYRGLWPALLASAPAAATFFGAYDVTKRIAGQNLELPEPITHLIAAGAGEVCGSAVRTPFEKLKQRLQAGMERTTLGALRSLVAREGVRGVFRGCSSLVVRELPFELIEFPLYEYLKSQWAKEQNAALSANQSALCGSIAGGIAAAVTTPLDVVKTRMLIDTSDQSATKNVLFYLRSVAEKEGVRGLFAGVLPRTIWISLGGFIFFGGYEYTKAYLLHSQALITEPTKERPIPETNTD